jgi:glycerol uptake facilitator-like aquaporin
MGPGPVYWAGEIVGAFIGAVLVFSTTTHWSHTEDADLKLAVYSTGRPSATTRGTS